MMYSIQEVQTPTQPFSIQTSCVSANRSFQPTLLSQVGQDSVSFGARNGSPLNWLFVLIPTFLLSLVSPGHTQNPVNPAEYPVNPVETSDDRAALERLIRKKLILDPTQKDPPPRHCDTDEKTGAPAPQGEPTWLDTDDRA